MSQHPCDGTELTCREICEFVMAFLDGELPEREQEVFKAHLALCPPCVCYLETYRKTVTLGKNACTDPNPPQVPEDLVKAILAARKKQPEC